MRVNVDLDLCESNGVCEGLAPEVFRVDDDDVLRIVDDRPGEELRPAVEEAVRSCPKQALRLED